jgi:hypothetical protein
VIPRHIYEHAATAVVVPTFGYVDPERHIVTDLAALITPWYEYRP